MENNAAALSEIVQTRETEIVTRWQELLASAGGGAGRMKDAELGKQCRDFLSAFATGLRAGAPTASDPAFAPARELLDEVVKGGSNAQVERANAMRASLQQPLSCIAIFHLV